MPPSRHIITAAIEYASRGGIVFRCLAPLAPRSLNGKARKPGKGGTVKTNGARRMIGAMAAVAIAICATYADAQTAGGMQNDAATQSPQVTASSSSSRARSDSQLVRDVRRAFTRTTGLNSSAIHVQARHGVVTLTGRVPQRSQIQRAGNAARSVRGVRSVSNRLTVQTRRSSGA
jgi:hyperosmotically inducible protein